MKALRVALGVVLLGAVIVAATLFFQTHHVPVLHPVGVVGQQESHLIILALLLSLIVVVPVFGMLFAFAWRYRAGNKKAKYSPELDHNVYAETIWWGIPSILILILSVFIWNSSHQLDPYKPLASSGKPMTIQVVALDWKWLFIYPSQHVASVNFVQFPVGTPVDFEITSDTVMNAFWVPDLGSQIYAMPGMMTQLHLQSDRSGSFRGSSANISGAGFAGMTFTAKASSQADFDTWVQTAQHASKQLDGSAYAALARPSQNNPVTYYTLPDNGLYNTILMKYMMPGMTAGQPMTSTPNMNGMVMP